MFRDPVTTIRDVAEATDASPELIARILNDIRGPGVVERIDSRLDKHDARISALERQPRTVTVRAEVVKPRQVSSVRAFPPKEVPMPTTKSRATDADWQRYRNWLADETRDQSSELSQISRGEIVVILTIIAIIALVTIAIANTGGNGIHYSNRSEFIEKRLPDGRIVLTSDDQ